MILVPDVLANIQRLRVVNLVENNPFAIIATTIRVWEKEIRSRKKVKGGEIPMVFRATETP